jgi:hypothetical protein
MPNRRNHLCYSLAFPHWSLASPNDNTRVYATDFYYGYF